MDIQYLHTFKTITESSSFAQAADKLGYTRSTVTFHVQQLEKEFGFKLFEKIGRKMNLTQKGQEVLPYVDNILLNYKQISTLSDRPHGKVRIAVVESYLTFKFQNVIKEVRRSLPDVELDIQTIPCPTMYDAILHGKIDLALHYDTLGNHPSIHTEEVCTYPLVLFGSSERTGNSLVSEKDETSAQIDFIDLEEDGFYQHCLDHALQENHVSILNNIIMGSVSSLIQCVKANLGIAVLPAFAIEQELARGTVHPIEADLQPDSISIAVSYHRNKWLSPAITTILRIIKQTI